MSVVADMNSIQENNAEGRRSAVSVSVSLFVILYIQLNQRLDKTVHHCYIFARVKCMIFITVEMKQPEMFIHP